MIVVVAFDAGRDRGRASYVMPTPVMVTGLCNV
jgi:hypothetical protein